MESKSISTVKIGRDSLISLSPKEVILGLRNISSQSIDHFSCTCVLKFQGGISDKGWDDAGGAAHAKLEGEKPSGGIYHVHHLETNARESVSPPMLVVINMVPNALVQSFVSSFRGTVGLWVVS